MSNVNDSFVILTDEAWDGSSLIITQLTGNIYNFNGNDTSGTATNVAEATTGTFHDTNTDGGLDDFSSIDPEEPYTANPGTTLPGTSGLLMFSLEVQSRVTFTNGTSQVLTLDVMVLNNNRILFDFGDAIITGTLNQNPPIATIEIIGNTQNAFDFVNIGAHDAGYVPLCYTSGSKVRMENGVKPVEDLKVGDKVWTFDNGLQPVRWIYSRRLGRDDLVRNPKLRPVVISKGALGLNTPSNDLRISRQHRVLVSSTIVRRMFAVDQVLVPAIDLIKVPGVSIDDTTTEVVYFHLLLDRHEVMEVDGVLSESLYTGRDAVKNLPLGAKRELQEIFPEIFFPQRLPRTARLTPEKQRARKLIIRHAKNGKPLLIPA